MAFPSKPLTQLLGSSGPVHAIAYSASPSTYILTGSSDRSIRLYNPSRVPTAPSANPPVPPKPTQLIQTYSAHGHEVLSLAVAPDNATFASAGGDRAVFLWDVTTANTIRRFGGNQGHTARVNAVAFAGEAASVLVSGSFDASLRIWDVKSGNPKPIMVMNDAGDSVSCLEIGEAEVWAGSTDGKLRKYDLRMGQSVTDVIGAPVTSLQKTMDGRGILVGCLDSKMRLMDVDSGTLLKTYQEKGWQNDEFRIWCIFGGRERWVLSGNEAVRGPDGEVFVWDTLTGNILEKVIIKGSHAELKKKIGRDGKEKERRNVISCLAWKENGKGEQWCCGGTDGIVTVFGPP